MPVKDGIGLYQYRMGSFALCMCVNIFLFFLILFDYSLHSLTNDASHSCH